MQFSSVGRGSAQLSGYLCSRYAPPRSVNELTAALYFSAGPLPYGLRQTARRPRSLRPTPELNWLPDRHQQVASDAPCFPSPRRVGDGCVTPPTVPSAARTSREVPV